MNQRALAVEPRLPRFGENPLRVGRVEPQVEEPGPPLPGIAEFNDPAEGAPLPVNRHFRIDEQLPGHRLPVASAVMGNGIILGQRCVQGGHAQHSVVVNLLRMQRRREQGRRAAGIHIFRVQGNEEIRRPGSGGQPLPLR